MPTPEGSDVDELRRMILADAPEPAVDPADVAQLATETFATIRRGRIEPRATSVRVRLTGDGVPGHDIPVHTASQLLDAIQGTVTAFGSAARKQKRAKAPKDADGHRMGVRKATELRLSAGIAPGSVVFLLEGLREQSRSEVPLVPDGTDTLVDVAVREMLRVIEQAESDKGDAIGDLTTKISSLGAMVASTLNRLAEHSAAHDIEVDLGHWSPSGARSTAVLRKRGAEAIKDAVERNRTRVVPETFTGTLRTVSDGADLCRMTLDDGSALRLSVDPLTGQGLGALLTKRVVAEVETTINWKIASGRESRSHALISAALAEDE